LRSPQRVDDRGMGSHPALKVGRGNWETGDSLVNIKIFKNDLK